MSGLRLSELSGEDLLDVLHFMLEEDNYFVSGEQMDARNKVRVDLYRDLYGETYKYSGKSSRASNEFKYEDLPEDSLMEHDADVKPFNPREKQDTKPFVPPTQYDPGSAKPFGSVLDAPL